MILLPFMQSYHSTDKEWIQLNIDKCKDELMGLAQDLLATDSPSGFTHQAADFVAHFAQTLGYSVTRNNKGNVIVDLPGLEDGPALGLCAHIDTLGLMVRSITDKGQLMITRVGGPTLPTLDGEYCKIYTREGKVYTGTILSLSPAAHVFEDAATRARDEQSLAIRIDEVVKSKADVEALGIMAGDFVCFDPKTVVTESGFLKSRFIDDKGSAACMLMLLKLLHDEGKQPKHPAKFIFSIHEEVGHGGATIPAGLSELLIVDMGCIGMDLTCTEYQVSICAKDSGGPYDYDMTSRLVALAKANDLGYAVDIYPHYSSDATVAWRAGHDVRAALIGPGVHASHGMERTHWDGLKNTIKLMALYLECN